MKGALSLAARAQLGTYRAVASLYRGALVVRLLFPCRPQRRLCLQERIGRWDGTVPVANRTVWVHAASLGEVLTAAPLLAAIRSACPASRIVLTCQTATGRAAGNETVADEVRYFPIDTPGVVDRVLARLRPDFFLFVETEIWPSLLLLLACRGVPAAMVNASVSQRSFARYRHVSALIAAGLGTLAAVCARDGESEQRLKELGAPAGRTTVCGDLKSDALIPEALSAIPDALGGLVVPVLVAASTHAGEDEIVMDAFARVRSAHPDARLVLAPRHPERAGDALAASRARGWTTRARSRDPVDSDWDVLVVDTTGELRRFFRSAAGVFVGGSLVAVGGHNLFEPALFACPVASGPHVDGVRDQAEALLRRDGLTIVDDAAGLADCWSGWIADPEQARAAGRRSREAVRECGGALQRTLEVLASLLAIAVGASEKGYDGVSS